MTDFRNIILLLRPYQWLKNVFVFLPLFFSGHLFDLDYLQPCILVFLAFCFAASGIYCFNDINDIDADKRHPIKSKRPIASGAIKISQAYLIMIGCFLISIFILSSQYYVITDVNRKLYVILAIYVLNNLAYCTKLKHVAIVDAFIIAIGFILRILAGGFATGVYLTHWIILMTFLLALFLAFAKRRDDVVMYEEYGVLARKNVNRYNISFMNQLISIIACLTMMCYIMYTISPGVMEQFHCSYVYISSIFVLAGIFRYLQLTVVDVKSGSPTKVLIQDHFIHGCIIGWLVFFVLIIYILE